MITAASEVMAVLSLADDLADLRRRLGRIVVARDRRGRPVAMEELRAPGAMAALLVDAVKPNLVQTLEGSPVLSHTGPFGNIAQGTSSVIADRLGLRCAEFVVTEAGFGADLGAEKLFDLKCRQSGLRPAAAVRRRHRALPPAPRWRRPGTEGASARRRARGAGRRCGPARSGEPPDPGPERARLRSAGGGGGQRPPRRPAGGARCREREAALAAGASECRRCSTLRGWGRRRPGAGACRPRRRCSGSARLPVPLPGRDAAAGEAGDGGSTHVPADGLDVSRTATGQLEESRGTRSRAAAVCVAKTPFSLSHDAGAGPNPTGFRLPVREVRLQAGAGYVVALTGETALMPGLPEHPAAEEVDITPEGRIVGLR